MILVTMQFHLVLYQEEQTLKAINITQKQQYYLHLLDACMQMWIHDACRYMLVSNLYKVDILIIARVFCCSILWAAVSFIDFIDVRWHKPIIMSYRDVLCIYTHIYTYMYTYPKNRELQGCPVGVHIHTHPKNRERQGCIVELSMLGYISAPTMSSRKSHRIAEQNETRTVGIPPVKALE